MDKATTIAVIIMGILALLWTIIVFTSKSRYPWELYNDLNKRKHVQLKRRKIVARRKKKNGVL